MALHGNSRGKMHMILQQLVTEAYGQLNAEKLDGENDGKNLKHCLGDNKWGEEKL